MKLVLYLYTGDRSGTRGWTQCILEEVCVAPRRSRGAGAQGRRVQCRSSYIVLKCIVAGPQINRLHEFEGVQGK